MKSYFLIICLSLMTQLTYAQDMKNFKLYNPYENVDSALKIVLTQAKKRTNMYLFRLVATGVYGVQGSMIL